MSLFKKFFQNIVHDRGPKDDTVTVSIRSPVTTDHRPQDTDTDTDTES